jgi:hypothetical protein
MAESIGTSTQAPVRNWPFIQRTRPSFEIGDDGRPPLPVMPSVSCPTIFMDMELKDWVVVTKGTILALAPVNQVNPFTLATVVPANGGTANTWTYTVNDQSAVVIDPSGNLATAGEQVTNVANEPFAVAPYDYFQNIKGRYLNYQIQPDALGVLTRRTIELPYFTYADLGSPASVAAAVALMQPKIYGAVYASTGSASGITYTASTHDNIQNGNWLMSDPNGKFVKWDGQDVKQVCGQAILVDTNYPKDMLQYVQTYPMSEVPGSETGGYPALLAAVGATKAVRLRLKF